MLISGLIHLGRECHSFTVVMFKQCFFVRFSFVWKTVVSTQRKNGTTWVMTSHRKFFNSFVQACVSDPDFFLFARI